MQVAVSTFKADEAIVMLSFAYPEATLGDSAAIPQSVKPDINSLRGRAIAREPMRSCEMFLGNFSDRIACQLLR